MVNNTIYKLTAFLQEIGTENVSEKKEWENAVEAAKKVKKNKYIQLFLKYDKKIFLLLYVIVMTDT